jgi:hypothetical protein
MKTGFYAFCFFSRPPTFYPAGLRHTGTCPVSIRQVPTSYSDISWIVAHALHRPPARAALASVLLLYHQNRRLPDSTIPSQANKRQLAPDWHLTAFYIYYPTGHYESLTNNLGGELCLAPSPCNQSECKKLLIISSFLN